MCSPRWMAGGRQWPGGRVEFSVLGPLQVSRDGRPVAIGTAPKRRLVLAVLLARAGQPVPTDTLMAAVWGARPPSSARRNLQLYIHQLRRALGDGCIVAAGDGYTIAAGDPDLDAAGFRRLSTDGAADLDAGDPGTAATTLRTALDLWRGQAFAEFLDCEPVAEAAARLELLRLETYGRWAEAQLAAGATPRLAAELAELCRLHPYRETLRGYLMRALYDTGRQAEALAVYRDTRALLIDQLGVDPGPSLQQLHAAMLRGDRTLLPHPHPPAKPATPRGLPPDSPVFAGREGAIGFLDESLPDRGGPARPVVVSGMGGVGKTTLVVRWAHRVTEHFPDGQLYLDLRGYAPGPPMPAVEAAGLLLRALGVPPAQVPVELDAATESYRTRLAGRRVLLVLDNARNAEQVRPLLPASTGCRVVVTSRDRLTGLVARDGARRIPLDLLSQAEAASLVARLVPGTDPHTAATLARACGRLPLAIRIAAAHLADRPGLTVTSYAEALRAGLDLDGLEVGGDPATSVRETFAHSYRALDPAARRLFRLLSLIPGDVTAQAAAALAGTDPRHAQRLLDVLVRAHLLDQDRARRHARHDLLQTYAGELARAADRAELTEAAAQLHQFYLRAVDAAARLLYPQAARLPIPVPEGLPDGIGFADQATATEWLDAELATLVAIVDRTAADGPRQVAWLLADALGGYFWLRRRYSAHWLTTARAGLAAATDHDLPAQAAAQLNLSQAYQCLGRPAKAIGYATEALTLSRQLGWPEAEATALSSLAANQADLGHNLPALASFEAALAVNRQLGHHAGEAGAYRARCGLRFRMGQLREALADGLAALDTYQHAPNPASEASAHLNTAMCHLYLGDLDPARDHLAGALRLYSSVGEQYGHTMARCGLTKLHFDAGRPAEAVECGKATLRDALANDDPTGAALSLIDLVEVRRLAGDHRHAVRDTNRAVRLARTANRPYTETHALLALAEAYLADHQPDAAAAQVATARRITRRYGFRLLEGLALTILGEIRLAVGDPAAATLHGQAALAIHRQTGYRQGEDRCRALPGQPAMR